jgi:hypothetical protein
MIDEIANVEYNDEDDRKCLEEYLTPDDYLDYLDRKLYEQSNRY